MSFSVGILGLPNVGKSTLFSLLTKKQVQISNYPFCTIEPNVGVVAVPDFRLAKLKEIAKEKEAFPTILKFVDVAGLVKGASKGEGLGNQFLAHLREVNLLLEVVRLFEREDIPHIIGDINPKRDIEIIKEELAFKDLETIEKRLEKIEKRIKQGEKDALFERDFLASLKGRIFKESAFELKKSFSEKEKEIISKLNLLTLKPKIYLFNGKENELKSEFIELLKDPYFIMDFQQEQEKLELCWSEKEKPTQLETNLDKLIRMCYRVLNLITFFTIVGKEIRAWTLEKESPILKGAEKIHSDFKEKFIKAQVINWEKLVKIGDWKKARELGEVKVVGKDYILKEGDVIEIKI